MRKAKTQAVNAMEHYIFSAQLAQVMDVPLRLFMFPVLNGRKRSPHRHRNRGRA